MEMDWNLKKIGLFFLQVLMPCLQKSPEKTIIVSSPDKKFISFDIFLDILVLQEQFVYE